MVRGRGRGSQSTKPAATPCSSLATKPAATPCSSLAGLLYGPHWPPGPTSGGSLCAIPTGIPVTGNYPTGSIGISTYWKSKKFKSRKKHRRRKATGNLNRKRPRGAKRTLRPGPRRRPRPENRRWALGRPHPHSHPQSSHRPLGTWRASEYPKKPESPDRYRIGVGVLDLFRYLSRVKDHWICKLGITLSQLYARSGNNGRCPSPVESHDTALEITPENDIWPSTTTQTQPEAQTETKQDRNTTGPTEPQTKTEHPTFCFSVANVTGGVLEDTTG